MSDRLDSAGHLRPVALRDGASPRISIDIEATRRTQCSRDVARVQSDAAATQDEHGSPGPRVEVARRDTGHILADLDRLRDALVADGKGRRQWRAAEEDHQVDVTRRRCHRPDQRISRRLQTWFGNLAPLHSSLGDEGQLTHRGRPCSSPSFAIKGAEAGALQSGLRIPYQSGRAA
jgi:hypothetical protein